MADKFLSGLSAFGDKVFVRIQGQYTQASTAKVKMQKGEVVDCGSSLSVRDSEPKLKMGDVVMFVENKDTEIEYQGEMYVILREDEILGRSTK